LVLLSVGYKEKVVVIGAGISGLACAHRLKQLGLRPRVLEATERSGGLINTVRRDGFLFETGPQLPRFPASVWQLVCDLNLECEFVPADSKAKRYIFRRGRLHLVPFSPGGLIKTQLLGFKSKLRILGEPFGFSRPPDWEESLAGFVQRKFGTEVLDNLVDPIISTVFLGDPRKMGMESAFPALVEWERNRGSLVRGALYARKSKRDAAKSGGASRPPTFHSNGNHSLRVTDSLPTLGSFRSGMATLPERLAEELKGDITYKATVESIAPSRENAGASKPAWQIYLSSSEQITAQYLVLAVPARVAARLLETSVPQLSLHLKAIEYAPISVVSSAYERSKVANRLAGFGFMVPRRKGLNTICTFWNSSLFGGRAPEGTVLITSFAESEENTAGPGAASEEKCTRAVEGENARILGISGKPLVRSVWKDPHALPQYNVGHARRVTEIYGILPTLPNFYLAGNFLKGRSIGDCVDVAYRVAENLHCQLQRHDI
jgi:protoporphyrinogen/coproporphyrinogen III oxidase